MRKVSLCDHHRRMIEVWIREIIFSGCAKCVRNLLDPRMAMIDPARLELIPARIMVRIKPVPALPSPHWHWVGPQDLRGNAWVRSSSKKTMLVHRYLWEVLNVRKLGPGRMLRRLCDDVMCIAPAHRRPVRRSFR